MLPACDEDERTGAMSEHERTDLFRLHLDEVGWHPLLTKQDEIAMSHAYEAGLPGLAIAGAAA